MFADRQTDRTLFGWEMPTSYFQSVNPLAIILLAPLFFFTLVKIREKKLEPTSPKKMAIGFIFSSSWLRCNCICSLRFRGNG
ncbi:MAG: hypothetical protein U0T78_04720 [Cloacibacterium normanense]